MIEILAYEQTPLGILCLRRRELLSRPGTIVTEVTLNHEFLMSSYLTESEKALSTIGLELLPETVDHPKVLIGGFGLGYTASAALGCPEVASVEVVEFLPEVMGWFNAGLIPLSEELKQDSRLTVVQDDVYARLLRKADQAYDLIAIDVDHSPEDVLGEQSNGFYSIAGLQQVKTHLTPEGVLGIWSYAESSPLLTHLQQVFAQIEVRQVTVWNDLIDEEQTDWLFFAFD